MAEPPWLRAPCSLHGGSCGNEGREPREPGNAPGEEGAARRSLSAHMDRAVSTRPLTSRYATLPGMYLTSRLFPSADVAFIAYVSLNFVLGLCTLLMTTMPRLLAVVTRAQVGHQLPQT